MADDIIDLLPSNPATPAASSGVVNLCTPSPHASATPSTIAPTPQPSTLQPNSEVTPSVVRTLRMPSMFDTASSPVKTENTPTDAGAGALDVLAVLDDDSDDELNELFHQRKKGGITTTPDLSHTPRPSQIRSILRPETPSIRPASASAAAPLPGSDPSLREVDPKLLDMTSQYAPTIERPSMGSDDEVFNQKADVSSNIQIKELLELNSKSSDATAEMSTPLEMNTVLLKHQRQALAWMVKREEDDKPLGHPRGGILADDQGFGKTLSTISLLLTNQPSPNADGTRKRWGTLIICPTSILYQWAAELRERIHVQYRPRVLIYHGATKVQDFRELLHYDVVLTTYGTLVSQYPKETKQPDSSISVRRAGALYRVKWFRLILDEAQAIRNFRRESFKAACALHAERKWSLSGTPIQNTLNDIYAQFLFLGYHITQSYKEWEIRYKKPLESGRNSEKRFKAFQAILGVVLLRRAKHDKIDGKPVIELPQRTTTVLELEFSRTERVYYESQEVRAVQGINRIQQTTHGGSTFAYALVIFLRLRQACGHPALCAWDTEQEFKFTDDELDAVDIRMRTKSLFKILPEEVRNRLYTELSPQSPVAQTCPICIDIISGDGIVTSCGHVFCSSDFEEWRRNSDSCPACRGNLNGENDAMSLEGVRKEIHAIYRKKQKESQAKENKAEASVQTSVCKSDPINLMGDFSEPADSGYSSSSSKSKAEPMELGLDFDEITSSTRVCNRRSKQLKNEAAKSEPTLANSSSGKGTPAKRRKRSKLETGEVKQEQQVPVLRCSARTRARNAQSETNTKTEDVPKPKARGGQKRRKVEPKKEETPEPETPVIEVAEEPAKQPVDQSDSSSDASDAELENRIKKKRTSAKIARFLQEYKNIFDTTDDKVLCFSQWTRMLDLIERSLKEEGYEYVRLDGSMTTLQRDENVRLFNTRSKCRLFLISLQAGSTGLNLTVANRVFLMDSWWNPAVEDQAIDRVHRIGQKKDVHVMKLKIANTVENDILNLQKRKRAIVDGALGVEGLKTLGRRRLNMRDLMDLFENVANNVADRAERRNDNRMVNIARNALDMARNMGESDLI